ncbi:MAG: type II toxin-antitoxin system RelE/ParE family toxin [Clostridiales bacterium]|jgi:mRNA interferase RelE/StbE|nr:type II toxin-antitoxin system RelE/ParE family toxin [Clostridiales bacterium]
MEVKISSKVLKYIKNLNEPHKSRIQFGLLKLEKEPPQGDIKKMSGNDTEYRLRIGDYRILFEIENTSIFVYDIDLRGQIYKKRRLIMTTKQEIYQHIDNIPDYKLPVLIPLLEALADEPLIIETNLTKREKEIIKKGREERLNGAKFYKLNEIKES